MNMQSTEERLQKMEDALLDLEEQYKLWRLIVIAAAVWADSKLWEQESWGPSRSERALYDAVMAARENQGLT